jgi:hypothetical protein
MTIRIEPFAVAFFVAFLPAGCHKPAASTVSSATTVTDFRTFTLGGIEIIIADKTGSAVTLKAAGPNKYTGTRKVPGETMELPVTVTVEEKRIIIESSGGGLTSRQIITPRGLEKDDLR